MWRWLRVLRNIVLYSLAFCGILLIIFTVYVIKTMPDTAGSPSAVTIPKKEIILVPTKIPTNAPPPTATPSPVPTNTPVPPAPPFADIRANMGAMTDVQWDSYTPGLKGLAVVDWSGWVEDVRGESSGAYEVWVDMDSPQELFSLYDVAFLIRDRAALKLRKDAPITFSGKIKRVYKSLGTLQVDLVETVLSP